MDVRPGCEGLAIVTTGTLTKTSTSTFLHRMDLVLACTLYPVDRTRYYIQHTHTSLQPSNAHLPALLN